VTYQAYSGYLIFVSLISIISLQSIMRKIIRKRLILGGLTVLAAFLSWALYSHLHYGLPFPGWTGFEGYVDPTGVYHPGKNLWDWLDLLIIPFILSLVAYLLNEQQKKRETADASRRAELEREIAKTRFLDSTFHVYLNDMTALLLDHKLHEDTTNADVRSIARAKTLTTVRILDAYRKGIVISFLSDADLLKIISLKEIDLVGVNLDGVNLENVNLESANLENTTLKKAVLNSANLRGANLHGANLSEAKLDRSNLVDANLNSAILTNASLNDADLISAQLIDASLKSADLSSARLYKADLERANMIGCKLYKTSLESCSMRFANLETAKLDSTTLFGADLEGANFLNAQLISVNLTHAKVSCEQLRAAGVIDNVNFPDHFSASDIESLSGNKST
jgi:uncharacterized protein YjbI with pentapeptide repeats